MPTFTPSPPGASPPSEARIPGLGPPPAGWKPCRGRADGPDGGGQGGQALPLVVAALALAGALVVGLVHHGARALDAARARTAADAAALAGAAEGEAAAHRLAAANGAAVVGVATRGADVVVTVRVGRASATARARREGTWCGTDTGRGRSIPYTSPPCPSSQG